MTVLYRPARKSWLNGIMENGRQSRKTTLAPTNLNGVRSLLKTLKTGQTVDILPDQVPDLGDGVWPLILMSPPTQ